MESELLLNSRAEKLAGFQALAETPKGRSQLTVKRDRFRMLIRREDGPPDNPLSAQLCALEGETNAWDFAVIVWVLEPYEVSED